MIGAIREMEQNRPSRLFREAPSRWALPSYKPEWQGATDQPAGSPNSDAAPGPDAPLLGLTGSNLVERFRSWRGRSGRRYIFSVFPLDRGAAWGDLLPDQGGAVVIAAERRDGAVREPLWIDQTGAHPRTFFRHDRIRALAARGNCELHVHLLAMDPAERQAVVDDLRPVVRNRT